MRGLIAVLAATAVLAAACGSSGSAEESSAVAEEEAWLQAVDESFAAVSNEANESFLDVEAALLAADTDEALAVGAAATAAVLEVVDVERGEFAAVDPPEAFVADRDRLLALLDEVEGLLDEAAAAAATGDVDGLVSGLEATGRAVERTLGELSPTVAGHLAIASDLASRYPELSDQDLTYLAGVSTARLEFAERNAAFSQAIGRIYSNPSALLDALLEAGVGEGFVAQREVAAALEPSQRFSDDHEAWLDYLDEAVAIDDRARTAAEDGDIVAFVVANTELGAAGSRLTGEVSQPFREATGAPAPPDDLPGGEYGTSLFVLLDRLDTALLGPTGPVSPFEGFPGMSPAEILQATAGTAPVITGTLTAIRDELDVLQPPDELAADHATLITYLDLLLVLHGDLDARAAASDEPAVAVATGALVEAWCATAADLTQAVSPLAAVHFGVAPGDSRCATAFP